MFVSCVSDDFEFGVVVSDVEYLGTFLNHIYFAEFYDYFTEKANLNILPSQRHLPTLKGPNNKTPKSLNPLSNPPKQISRFQLTFNLNPQNLLKFPK